MKQTRNSKGQFRQIPKISSVYFTTLSRIVISVKRHAYCDFKESTSSVVILGKQTRNYKLTRSIRKKWTSFAIYQTEVELSKWILYFKAPCKRKESCWILNVASVCTLCCMFCVSLAVVAQTLKPVKLLATCKRTHQLPTILIVFGQQCCVRLHQA